MRNRAIRSWLATLYLLLLVQPGRAQQQQRGPLRLRAVPPDLVLPNNTSQQYHAFLSFFRGTGQPGVEKDIGSFVNWSSSDSSLVSITPAGLATSAATATGKAWIKLSSGMFRIALPIEISNATLQSITVTPASPTVAAGYGVQLTAQGNYSDGSTHDLTWVASWSSNATSIVAVDSLGRAQSYAQGQAVITAVYGGVHGQATINVSAPAVVTLSVVPTNRYLAAGLSQQFSAYEALSDGSFINATNSVAWNSLDPSIASVTSAGLATGLAPGNAPIQASASALSSIGTLAVLSTTPVGRYRVQDTGTYAVIEERGWPSGYYSGELLYDWNNVVDSITGNTNAQETALQMDAMRAMGMNIMALELRTADATNGAFTPPQCTINPVLGPQWPQPTAADLAGLGAFFDLAQSKGLRIWLHLVNTHQEEQPPTNSQTWLSAIFGVIKNKPALDYVSFDGDVHIELNGSCGIPAETPLWQGPPPSAQGTYVQWAIGYAMSQGIAASKLGAEAIEGDYFTMSQPPNPYATDGHLWDPIRSMKIIYDNLNIPSNQRTYSLSWYEHRKCATANGLPCTDTDPDTWSQQTMQSIQSIIGTGNGSRIIATETGDFVPVSSSWPTNWALESLIDTMEKYDVEGGAFWRWVSYQDSEDTDPTLAQPVKIRGLAFNYNPVQKEILDMAGYHLTAIPNGSFENGGAMPDNWTASGSGTASRYLLTQQAGEPEVPSRGNYALRLVTGSASSDQIQAASLTIAVSPSTAYTTTANLRFNWTGDPNPSAPAASRPQVFVAINYFQPDATPSLLKQQDIFRYFQENSTGSTFATFPLQYTTPGDATNVQIIFGTSRNGLPTAITFDADNTR